MPAPLPASPGRLILITALSRLRGRPGSGSPAYGSAATGRSLPGHADGRRWLHLSPATAAAPPPRPGPAPPRLPAAPARHPSSRDSLFSRQRGAAILPARSLALSGSAAEGRGGSGALRSRSSGPAAQSGPSAALPSAEAGRGGNCGAAGPRSLAKERRERGPQGAAAARLVPPPSWRWASGPCQAASAEPGGGRGFGG